MADVTGHRDRIQVQHITGPIDLHLQILPGDIHRDKRTRTDDGPDATDGRANSPMHSFLPAVSGTRRNKINPVPFQAAVGNTT